MDALDYGLFGITFAGAVLYLFFFCYRPYSPAKPIIKLMGILPLAIISFLHFGFGWLTLALLACAAGDYFLTRDNKSAFLSGVAAFALGHVFYICLFLTSEGSDIQHVLTISGLVFLCILLGVGWVMLKKLHHRTGELRHAVSGYIIIILSMGIAAMTLPFTGGYELVILGVTLFIISDIVLSLELFVLQDSSNFKRIAPFIIWSFYWMAQFSILGGFLISQ